MRPALPARLATCLRCGALVIANHNFRGVTLYDGRLAILQGPIALYDLTGPELRAVRDFLGRDQVASQGVGIGDGGIHLCLPGRKEVSC